MQVEVFSRMMKSLSTLALLLGQQAQAQDAPPCHEAMMPGLLRLSGCEGDCANCHVENINTVLCPNDLCCTVGGVGQAAGDTAVGTTTPTICTSTQQPASATCAAAGDACTHFGHPGTCNADLLCEDQAVCSDSKLEHSNVRRGLQHLHLCSHYLGAQRMPGCGRRDGYPGIRHHLLRSRQVHRQH